MKRIIAIIIIFLGIGVGIGSVAANTNTGSVLVSPVIKRQEIGEPSIMFVPKLGISAHVEQVGEDEFGRMGIPENVNNVGWWRKGVRPGQKGKAVFAGHVDTPDGQKGIFYRITELSLGDEIRVIDRLNKVYVFEVTRTESFPDDSFPIDLVFGDSDEKELNLITCWGAYDSLKSNYLDRMVVFSKLKAVRDE